MVPRFKTVASLSGSLSQLTAKRVASTPYKTKVYNASLYSNCITLKNFVMIIVHDTFVCKPGNASKLAKKFKEAMASNNELVNVMTDMTGQFNRVIMVTKYDNLTAYEQSWEKYMKQS